MKKGKLIVLEGIDGCGKTTQCKRLAAALREKFPDKTIWETREPTDGPVGRLIREEYLSGKRKCPEGIINILYLADRYEHIFGEDGILHHLAQGDIVICDRFYYSSFVYSTYENIPELNTPDQEWETAFLESIHKNQEFLEAVVPDLLVYLDLPTELAMERIDNSAREGTEIYETASKLNLINHTYQYVVEYFNSSVHNEFLNAALDLGIKREWMTRLAYIDGTKDIDTIASNILQYTLPIVGETPFVPYKMVFNPNPWVVKKIYRAIWENDGYCPSRSERIPENRCPCNDFYQGSCSCNLFQQVKE